MSVRFQDRSFSLTQPDGSTLEVRASGNQFRARFETPDGRPVVRNAETGWYEPLAAPRAGLARSAGGAAEVPVAAPVQVSPLRRETGSSGGDALDGSAGLAAACFAARTRRRNATGVSPNRHCSALSRYQLDGRNSARCRSPAAAAIPNRAVRSNFTRFISSK